MAFKSSLLIFSYKAISIICWSLKSTIIAGTSSKCAILAARHLLSPATISYPWTHITNTLRLLNLPEKIQEYVLDGSLSMGHARALITLDKERALKIAKRVIDEKLSVRDVENIVKGFELQEARENKPKVEKPKEYQYVEGLLRKKYRTRIKVDDKSITIKYSDTDDLNRL